MRKLLIILTFLIICLFVQADISDDAKLLKSEEKAVMEQRINELEKSFGVKFKIVITTADIDVKKYAESFSKGVIIHLKKDDKEGKLFLKLYFTKDIDIYTYKDEMQKILDDSQNLVDAEKYVDLVYEITGSISEMISLINAEEKAARQKTFSIAASVFLFFILIAGGAVFFIIKRGRRKKKNLCRFCDIEMDLVDEYQENNKTIRLYNCHVCGHSKKISFRH